ncbi:MAG: hypothetical protein Q7S61_04200 [bacterium]|nr:hypothetical protein [bacterium]
MQLLKEWVGRVRHENIAKFSPTIKLSDYGISTSDTPLDWSESTVYQSKNMKPKRVVKIFNTPFSHKVVDLETLIKYQELTAQARTIVDKGMVSSAGQFSIPVIQVIPIERVGLLADSRKFPVSVSSYVHGATLSSPSFQGRENLLGEINIEDTLYLSPYLRPHPKVIFGYGKYTQNAYTSV